MPRPIDAHARCFADIAKGGAGPGEIGQGRLLALLGAEGLRRSFLVVRFLVGQPSLVWDPAIAEGAIEARRIEATLASCAGRSWACDLLTYRDYLTSSARRSKVVRVHLTAASGLLTAAGLERGAR